MSLLTNGTMLTLFFLTVFTMVRVVCLQPVRITGRSEAIELSGLSTKLAYGSLGCAQGSSNDVRREGDRDRDSSVAIVGAVGGSMVVSESDGEDQDRENELIESNYRAFRVCASCLVDKSRVDVHCMRCDKCISDIDHHCSFLMTCVGRGNRRLFTLYALFAGLSALGYFYLATERMRVVLCSAPGEADGILGGALALQICAAGKDPAASLLSTVSVIVGLLAIHVVFSQIMFVASDTSSFMIMNGFYSGGACRLGCGTGCKNVLGFCSSGSFHIQKIVPEDTRRLLADMDVEDGHGHAHGHGHEGYNSSNSNSNSSSSSNNNTAFTVASGTQLDHGHSHGHSHGHGKCCSQKSVPIEAPIGHSFQITADDRV